MSSAEQNRVPENLDQSHAVYPLTDDLMPYAKLKLGLK